MEQIWTDEYFNHFLEMTKKKAEAKGITTYPKTKADLWRYILVNTGMGLIKFPQVKFHWSRGNPLYQSSCFSQLLSKNQYNQYRKAIDFDIEFFEDYLNYIFKKVYKADCVLVVDECIVLFKGRFAGRQHVRGKPHATGLKFYVLADKAGYCCSFWLYRGKDHASKHSSKPSDIVVDLVKTIIKPIVEPVPPESVREDTETAKCATEFSKDPETNSFIDLDDEETETDDEETDGEETETGGEETETDGAFKYLVIADSYFGSIKCGEELNNHGFFFILASRKNIDTELKKPLIAGLKSGTWRTIYHKGTNINYCVFNDRAVCTFLSKFLWRRYCNRNGSNNCFFLQSIYECS
mmetsp:Transcript_35190/g.60262  ORF Transcript_35190/g.60262 Transcript_35190/m.60262 type:complete len:352 (-) Transcript_35190:519-1574(-)